MELQPLDGREGGHTKGFWLDNMSRLLYFKGAAARLDALQKTSACPCPRVNGPKSTETAVDVVVLNSRCETSQQSQLPSRHHRYVY